MTVPIINAVALSIAALLWIRGLWRASMSDCAAGVCVAILWVSVQSLGTGSMKAINDLGICSAGLGMITFIIAFLIPDRPKMPRQDVMLAGAAMLFTGFLLSILL